jgi:hypothetical protein
MTPCLCGANVLEHEATSLAALDHLVVPKRLFQSFLFYIVFWFYLPPASQTPSDTQGQSSDIYAYRLNISSARWTASTPLARTACFGGKSDTDYKLMRNGFHGLDNVFLNLNHEPPPYPSLRYHARNKSYSSTPR